MDDSFSSLSLSTTITLSTTSYTKPENTVVLKRFCDTYAKTITI